MPRLAPASLSNSDIVFLDSFVLGFWQTRRSPEGSLEVLRRAASALYRNLLAGAQALPAHEYTSATVLAFLDHHVASRSAVLRGAALANDDLRAEMYEALAENPFFRWRLLRSLGLKPA